MDRSLFQHIILEHHKHPRCYGAIEQPDAQAEEVNQLCGDKIQIYVTRSPSGLLEVRFEANACSIVRASASIMACMLQQRSMENFIRLKTNFEHFLAGMPDLDVDQLGELVVFEGVKQYPTRKKCAILPWKALEKALTGLHPGEF